MPGSRGPRGPCAAVLSCSSGGRCLENHSILLGQNKLLLSGDAWRSSMESSCMRTPARCLLRAPAAAARCCRGGQLQRQQAAAADRGPREKEAAQGGAGWAGLGGRAAAPRVWKMGAPTPGLWTWALGPGLSPMRVGSLMVECQRLCALLLRALCCATPPGAHAPCPC